MSDPFFADRNRRAENVFIRGFPFVQAELSDCSSKYRIHRLKAVCDSRLGVSHYVPSTAVSAREEYFSSCGLRAERSGPVLQGCLGNFCDTKCFHPLKLSH